MGQGREVRRRQGRLIAGNVGPTFHNLAFRGSRQPVTGLGAALPDSSAELKDAPFTTHLPASGQAETI
jgi:hypothetical protein